MGMSHTSKGWRVLDVETNVMTVTRDAVFYEEMSLRAWKASLSSPSLPITSPQAAAEEEEDDVEEIGLRRSARPSQEPSRLLFAIEVVEEPLDQNVDEIEKALGLEASAWEDDSEPGSYKEAMRGEEATEWKKAADEEMQSLLEQGTWQLVERPRGRKVIGVKWVFKKKRDAEGKIARFKGRLGVKGYSQVEGVDYGETYAPVGSFTSARMLLALAAAWNCGKWT